LNIPNDSYALATCRRSYAQAMRLVARKSRGQPFLALQLHKRSKAPSAETRDNATKEGLRCVWAHNHVAKEVGAFVGRGSLLL
jgi:hypothetical protein